MPNPGNPQIASHSAGNLLGIISIVLWATTIAFSRSLAEELGTFTSGAYIFLGGGIISSVIFLVQHKGFQPIKRFSVSYLVWCGGLFVFYEVLFYISIGYAASRQQVLEVGLINYLWIGFTLVFSVLLLKKKAGWMLVPGIVVALAGVVMATLQEGYSTAELKNNLLHHSGPYIMALACGVSWGLYSALSRKLAADADLSVVPFFLFLTGAALLIIKFFVPEVSHWKFSVVLELAYTTLLPITLGYIFWDLAMRKGNVVLIASLSYFIPLVSTIISSLYLHVAMTVNLWVACLLVIAGAVMCRVSVRETTN